LDSKWMAWKIAEKAYDEGAEFTLSNTPVALRFGELNLLAEKCNSEIIPADATNMNDLNNVFKKTLEKYNGKIDFVLHSIGMSMNVRKSITYDDLDYNYYMKTIDISAISFHKMLQVAYKLDAINEWGSVVALSYIAAQRTLFRYNDMADAKAMLESIARSFGYIYGRDKKVRVNTVSQSPTLTTAGSGVKGIDALMDFTERMSPLGNATGDDLADFCITLFSDLTKKITMQNIFHDGGFSNMGMSAKAMHVYNQSLENYNAAD
jgi:enoyl-[acyl-carrier protein] reductase I